MAPDMDAHDETSRAAGPRSSTALMHSAARLYYLENATQADIAKRLGMSRATVSRLLSDARRLGMVHIEVRAPADEDLERLARRAEEALGLERVLLVRAAPRGPLGAALAPALSIALEDVGLQAGDVLLVSSGRTVYEAAQAPLPSLPGVILVPSIGGHDEPEPWYAPNEITRHVAERVNGTPTFLYAPALPDRVLHKGLLQDSGYQRVLGLWRGARCAVMGIGGPPLSRESLPRFVPRDAPSLRQAVGDVCSRFYDPEGEPLEFPGSERLVATSLEVVRAIPTVIGVAAGSVKVPSIRVAAQARYISQLVTDTATAEALLATS